MVRVKKITNTLIITSDERRFRKKDGLVPGNPWSLTSLSIPTDEDFYRIKQKMARSTIAKQLQFLLDNVGKITDDKLSEYGQLVGELHTKLENDINQGA